MTSKGRSLSISSNNSNATDDALEKTDRIKEQKRKLKILKSALIKERADNKELQKKNDSLRAELESFIAEKNGDKKFKDYELKADKSSGIP